MSCGKGGWIHDERRRGRDWLKRGCVWFVEVFCLESRMILESVFVCGMKELKKRMVGQLGRQYWAFQQLWKGNEDCSRFLAS